MGAIASQITSLTIVYSTVYSDADQRKHQSSASLAFVWGIHRDWWIPRTKGQLRGKCFHLMTSSCIILLPLFQTMCFAWAITNHYLLCPHLKISFVNITTCVAVLYSRGNNKSVNDCNRFCNSSLRSVSGRCCWVQNHCRFPSVPLKSAWIPSPSISWYLASMTCRCCILVVLSRNHFCQSIASSDFWWLCLLLPYWDLCIMPAPTLMLNCLVVLPLVSGLCSVPRTISPPICSVTFGRLGFKQKGW